MKNLNLRQIANHIDTSVREMYPSAASLRDGNKLPGNSVRNGEFITRSRVAPQAHQRDDRSFEQSLWGRR